MVEEFMIDENEIAEFEALNSEYTLQITFVSPTEIKVFGAARDLPIRFCVNGLTLIHALRNAATTISAAEQVFRDMPSIAHH